jgi:hypothetical protein
MPPIEEETWPRWLPGTTLRDPETHYVLCRGESGLCGQETMWAEPGHPTTKRPRCPDCVRLSRKQGTKVIRGPDWKAELVKQLDE